MILHPPFQISPRLLPALRVGDAWIQLEYAERAGRDGRTHYRYTIDLPDGSEFSDDDLQSGCGGGNLQEGFASLLDFLSAAAESYNYTQRGHASDNDDLFPPALMQWCGDVGSDEFAILRCEIEDEKWYVVDEEYADCPTLHVALSEEEASEWIGREGEPAKVERGGYGIDGPVQQCLIEE